jgi:hypothetical protein
MFKKIAITTIAASALLFTMQASASGGHHKNDASINKEQRTQAVMIQQGIKSCKITPSEARKARSTQKRIAILEKKFKANGMSRWERDTLKKKLHAARVEINQLTQNRTTCYSKKRSNGQRNDVSRGHRNNTNKHGYTNKRSNVNNHGHSNNRSGGSISVTVRNIH